LFVYVKLFENKQNLQTYERKKLLLYGGLILLANIGLLLAHKNSILLHNNNNRILPNMILLFFIGILIVLLITGKFESTPLDTIKGHIFLLSALSFFYYILLKLCYLLDLTNKRICAIWIFISGIIMFVNSGLYRRINSKCDFVFFLLGNIC